MAYTEDQIEAFLTLAQEVGIGRALRDLGYPKSYSTALYWAEKRGVSVNVDPVMKHVKQFDDLYKTEHMLAVIKEGVQRVYEELTENAGLTPDEQKKLSEAFQKYTNSYLVLQGKANDIKETHTRDALDVELARMIAEVKDDNANRDSTESLES